MKESTIITQFGMINKKCDMLATALKNNEKHFQQIYLIENAVSVTIDALMKAMIKKGLLTDEEIKTQIEIETKRRQEKRNEVKNAEVSNQPNFGEQTNLMPSQE